MGVLDDVAGVGPEMEQKIQEMSVRELCQTTEMVAEAYNEQLQRVAVLEAQVAELRDLLERRFGLTFTA